MAEVYCDSGDHVRPGRYAGTVGEAESPVLRQAAQRILGLPEPDPRAIKTYREILGFARDVASRHIMDRLNLELDLHLLLTEYGVSEPWEVLTALWKEIYDDMVADPQVIRDNQWPYTVGLLRVAR